MTQSLSVETLLAETAEACLANDRRLAVRLQSIVRRLAADPSLSLPRLMDEAELEGAYRFFSNPRVKPEAILAPHVATTSERCAREGRVLVVHDTTDFSYRVDGEREGLGRAISSSQTFYGHFSLAVAADGSRRPLGVTSLFTWIRGEQRSGVEHARWLAQIRAAEQALASTQAIHVFDREGDDYNLFAQALASDIHFVARALTDRWTVNAAGVVEKLKTSLASIEHVATRDAWLTRRRQHRSPVKAKIHPPRAPRTAKLCVASAPIALVRPANYGSAKYPTLGELPETIVLNVVRVWEPTPPEGDAPVEWVLYTNEPATTPEEVLAIVDHYRARWTIEEYFKALKTGCSFERRQLQDYESLVNALAVFAPVAYHILLLRSEARSTPNAPASRVLSNDEIDVLRALGRRKLGDAPTVREVMLAVAALGGHIKYAPDPGWLTLSRGYAELETLTRGWLAAKLQHSRDQR
jgi:Transposase DNA-binding/Transposase DDE domain